MDKERLGLEIKKAPKAPSTKIRKAKEPLDSQILDLGELERNFQLEEYFALAVQSLEKLNLEQLLFLVYCAWKQNKLQLLGGYSKDLFPLLSKIEFGYYNDFLKSHILRSEGQIRECFSILEELHATCSHWLIIWRFAAESLNFYDLPKATVIMKQSLPRLPITAQNHLQFNLGVAALNQGQMTTYQFIESQFLSDTHPLSQFYLAWLRGGYSQQIGQSQKSVDYYLEALEKIDQLPSRKTDGPILAFLILKQSVWTGDIYASRKAWEVLEVEGNNKNNLSHQSLSLATALYEINEGKLSEALLRLEAFFDAKEWNKDHLNAGDYYLWILMAVGDFIKGKRIINTLYEIREKLGFSLTNIEHQVIDAYFSYLSQEIEVLEFQKKILKLMDELKVKGMERGMNMAKFLFYLLHEDPVERSQAFSYVASIPFLQKVGVAILSHSRLTPSIFRQLKDVITNDLAKMMLDLHLSRLTEDIFLFVQTFKRLSSIKATAWIKLMAPSNSSLSLEFGRTLQNAELLIDAEARRVIALDTLETLDSQPLLAELTLSLFRNPHGLNKEMASLGVGYSVYDPIQHDPIIYNLISRLRDWLRKQGLSVGISFGKSGWCLTHTDLIKCYLLDSDLNSPSHEDSSSGLPLVRSSKISGLPPRLEWILLTIEKKGFMCRSELMSRFAIQKSTAANDFNELIERKLIQRHGNGRGIYYTLMESSI